MIRHSILICALLMAANAWAEDNGTSDPRFEKGVHYHEIDSATSTAPDRVEVVEVFSYTCPGCNSFLPLINQWHADKPEVVDFQRVQVIFQPSWEPYARAFFTAESLGIAQDGHADLFQALHGERRQIRSLDDLAEFWSNYGVEKDEFLAEAGSFAVDSKVRQSRSQVGRWGIPATPSVVVNGKWRITAGNGMNHGTMINVLDYLVEKEARSIQTAGETNGSGTDADSSDEGDEDQAAG